MTPLATADISTYSAELDSAHGREWDAIVIGAGIGGAVAAHQLARAGAKVLLVDKARFPRDKVCGCCLSSHAMGALAEAGLENVPIELGARCLKSFEWRAGKQLATLPLSGGLAISRSQLDQGLVQAAVRVGARFLSQALAQLGDCGEGFRTVHLRQANETIAHHARVVIVATGLSDSLLGKCNELAVNVAARARLGAHAIVDAPVWELPHDAITMVSGRPGYVGIVQLEDGRWNVAGAMDAAALREHGPGRLASRILEAASIRVPSELQQTPWHGTPAMTRRCSQVAAERLFLIGDVAAYVEPFTGEGMAWAARSALLVAPLAVQAIESWTPDLAAQWQQTYRRRFRLRQAFCRLTTRAIRQPAAARLIVRTLRAFPAIGSALAEHVHGKQLIDEHASAAPAHTSL